jgi:TRAP-type C4-dicarboxylate transport system permease small subunit
LDLLDRFVIKLEQVMICCAVPVMLVMGVLQIVSRFVIKAPIAWTEQLLTVLFVWTSYLGASVALANQSHFQVDVFVILLPQWAQKTLNVAADVVVISFCVFMIRKGWFLFERTANQGMAMLPFSIRWAYFCLPVTALGMGIHSLNHVWQALREGRDNP